MDKNKDAVPELVVSALSGSGVRYIRELFDADYEQIEGNEEKKPKGPPVKGGGRGRGGPNKNFPTKNAPHKNSPHKEAPPKEDPPKKTDFSTLRKKMAQQDNDLKKPSDSPRNSMNSSTIRGNKVTTVGGNFKNQLKNLYDTLCSTTPHYIRCIKPNPEKKPNVFHSEMVADQLRYSGKFYSGIIKIF